MKVVEFYALWLAALESEEYPQAKRTLRSPEGFCCLGVALEVMREHSLIEGVWEETESGGMCFVTRGRYLHGSLPVRISTRIRLDPVIDPSKPYEFERNLIDMNDKHGKTFPEIAAYIRQEILPKIDPNLELELS